MSVITILFSNVDPFFQFYDPKQILKFLTLITPGETKYEWKKTEQVPIQLPNIARTLFDAKKIIKKNFLAWTLEIIQFIWFENHMDGPG